MGIAVVGGMLISTFLTLFVVPVMYLYMSTARQAGSVAKGGAHA
jgi:multidrug efflux pump